jgi:hypothetical protein
MKNEIIKTQKNELVKFDKAAFMAKYDPVQVLTGLRHIKTIDEAIEDDKNGISVYSKQMGPDAMHALIEIHLVALSESVNVGQPLTKYQCKEIAIEILAVYYFLSMTELCYVLRLAKRGEYGQLYGVLNIVSILDWFAQYTNQRIQIWQKKSQNEGERRKKQVEIVDGKLYESGIINGAALEVLKKVKEAAPDKFDEEKFKAFKDEYNEKNKDVNED